MRLDQIAALFLFVTFLIGIRSTYRLWVKYRAISKILKPRRNIIGLVFFIVALMVTTAAGYYGTLSALHIFGVQTVPGVSFVSLVIAAVILFIPAILDGTFDYIAARGDGGDS